MTIKQEEVNTADLETLPKDQELSKEERAILNDYAKNLSLDTFIKPSVYQIDLDFDFKNLCYTGIVKIFGTSYTGCDKTAFDAAHLQLHNVGSELTSVGVRLGDNYYECSWKQIDSNTIELIPPENQPWAFKKLTEEMTVEIGFSSKVSDSLMGLYKVPFVNDKGEEFTYASSQCEPNGAREIFPHIDDPIAKAVFKLTVRVDEGLEVLSNTPAKILPSDSEGKVKYIFDDTPKMSSYLFALMVGKFHKRTLTTKKGLEMTYYNETAEDLERSKYAQEISEKIVSYFEDKFSIDYPLKKLDQMSLSKFVVNAMENWGMITYRKSALLQYDPKDQAATSKIVMVVAHEISHQWFGNLVTMKWWNDLWLNEGFATEMMYRASDAVQPELFNIESHLLNRMLPAYFDDSLLSSHPISVPVEKPEDIFEVFDAISYAKGSAFIRMLIEYAGVDEFYSGVSDYLNQYKYSNADCNDFLTSINDKCPIPDLPIIAEEWLKSPNYPILSVKKEGNQFFVGQTPFMKLHSNVNKVKTIWKIPLVVKSIMGKAVKTQKLIMDDTQLTMPAESADEYKIFNCDASGFYLVVYDAEFYKALPAFVESLSKYDLYTIFLSFFMRATSTNNSEDSNGVKLFTIPMMLTILTDINKHLPPLVVSLIANLLVSYYVQYGLLVNKSYVLKGINGLFEGRFLSITEDKHSPNSQIPANVENMHSSICKLMAIYRPDFALLKLRDRFETFDDVTGPFVEAYATALVACVHESNSPESAFEMLFAKYKESSNVTLKQRLLSSLPFVSKPEMRQKIYESMLNGVIQPMNYGFVSKSIGKSSKFSMEFFDFLDQENRFDIINEKAANRLGAVVTRAFNGLHGMEMVSRLHNMFEGKEHSAKMALKTVSERIEINSWKEH